MLSIRSCVICGDATRHGHLGVDACRACADFYRRTLLAGRKLVCRRGGGGCPIRKHVSSGICRRCRVDKCKAVGMKLSDADLAVVAVQDPPKSLSQWSELQWIAKAYQSFCNDRISAEMALMNSSKYRLYPLPRPNDKFVAANMEFTDESWAIKEAKMVGFVDRSFPDVAALPEMERGCMQRGFLLLLVLYEYNMITHKFFADSPRYLPISRTACLDLDNPEEFFPDGLQTKAQEKIDTFNYMKFYTTKYLEISSILKRMELYEAEEAALIALFMFSTGDASSPEVMRLAERRRASIFSQLHTFYRQQLGLVEYSQRLGHLCSLLAAMKESCALLREEMQIYRLLDVFLDDDFEQYEQSLRQM